MCGKEWERRRIKKNLMQVRDAKEMVRHASDVEPADLTAMHQNSRNQYFNTKKREKYVYKERENTQAVARGVPERENAPRVSMFLESYKTPASDIRPRT